MFSISRYVSDCALRVNNLPCCVRSAKGLNAHLEGIFASSDVLADEEEDDDEIGGKCLPADESLRFGR